MEPPEKAKEENLEARQGCLAATTHGVYKGLPTPDSCALLKPANDSRDNPHERRVLASDYGH